MWGLSASGALAQLSLCTCPVEVWPGAASQPKTKGSLHSGASGHTAKTDGVVFPGFIQSNGFKKQQGVQAAGMGDYPSGQ